ncbi:MAG: hypothetical protein ACHQ0Y_13235 [Thermodesulfovibrionales bacterium]
MIEQAKIAAVTEYLQSEFPDSQIDDTFDEELQSQKFRVSKDSTVSIIKFERIFLDDTLDIKEALKNMGLSEFIKLNNTRQVFVTTQGLKLL